MRTFLRSKALLVLAFGLLLTVPAVALADNLQDSITSGSNAKTITTTGGSSGSFENKYWIEEAGSGSDIGPGNCDIPAGGSATFKLNVPNEVTATSADGTNADGSLKIVFNACGTATSNTKSVTFSSNNPGVYTISASFVSGTGGVTDTVDGGFNENPANLTLTVVGVDSVTPADGATGVAANTDVAATFVTAGGTPSPLNTTTFKLVKDGTTTLVPAGVSYNSTTKTATLNPNADLELGTKYNATISGVSSDGFTLENKTWSFTTVAPACTNPADPVFQNTTPDGDNGWFVNTPTVSATSSTSGAVVKYSDAANGTYSTTVPTLGEGTTTVYAKAFSSRLRLTPQGSLTSCWTVRTCCLSSRG
jgi:Bacterial Ig-like domain